MLQLGLLGLHLGGLANVLSLRCALLSLESRLEQLLCLLQSGLFLLRRCHVEECSPLMSLLCIFHNVFALTFLRVD